MQFPFSYQIKIMKAQFWSYFIFKYLHVYHKKNIYMGLVPILCQTWFLVLSHVIIAEMW